MLLENTHRSEVACSETGSMKLVSACLLGINCRHDGGNCRNEKVMKLFKEDQLLPVCPEQLGGLPTPRRPSKLTGDGEEVLRGRERVIMKGKVDVTDKFVKGAREVLKLARLFRIEKAILKSESPSCGHGKIQKCSSEGLSKGDGVAAALLRRNGLEIITEGDL